MDGKREYNLEKRTAQFGKSIILWVKRLPRNDMTLRLIPQLVGSSTSVGANYCEADCSESARDFVHKLSIANKEIKESKHHIHMLAIVLDDENLIQEGRILWKEAHEINLIFITIIKKIKNKLRRN